MGIEGEQITPQVTETQPGQAAPTAAQIIGGTLQSGQQPSTETAQTYVTKAELEALREEMKRNVQSSAAKVEARVTKRMDELKTAGITATPEAVQKLLEEEDKQKSQVVPGSITPPVSEGQTAQPGSTTPPESDPVLARASQWMKEDGLDAVNPITAEAYRLMATSEIRITDEDPEAKSIGGKTAFEFLSSVNAAIDAKKLRLNLKGTPGRTPGLSSSTTIAGNSSDGMRGLDTLNEYYKGK